MKGNSIQNQQNQAYYEPQRNQQVKEINNRHDCSLYPNGTHCEDTYIISTLNIYLESKFSCAKMTSCFIHLAIFLKKNNRVKNGDKTRKRCLKLRC